MTGSNNTDGAKSADQQADLPVLRNRYVVNHNTPLPAFDTPSAKAYQVSDRRNPERPLYALVCRPDLPTRADAITRLRKAAPPGLLPLIEAGVTLWPLARRRASIVVFRRPGGGTALDAFESTAHRVSEYEVPKRIIAPAVRGLRSLEAIGVAHRAIRPSSLYFMDEQHTDLVFGPCVTAPPGFDQPVILEPVERAMAMPAGRGEGGPPDDLYALGASLALLIGSGDPLPEADDATIIDAKLTRGSFAVLCENRRIPLSLVEPLRGLLVDDPESRWTLEHLESWLSGQRNLSRGRRRDQGAATPFLFRGAPYGSLPAIAHALSRHPSDAAKVVRSAALQTWLVQQHKDPDLASRINDVVATTPDRPDAVNGSAELLVARVCVVLDPTGPVRYRSFRFMPDGLGPAFASIWLGGGDRQTAVQALSLGLADLLSRQAGSALSPLRRQFLEELSRFVQRPEIGQGPERCLYLANPGLACQSPLVADANVVEGDSLLHALEAAADARSASDLPMDRHIAAFIASRYESGIEPLLAALGHNEERRRIVAILGLFAVLQRTHSVTSLPKLTAWIGGRLGPTVAAYRSRRIREHIEEQMPKLIARGRMPELYDLVENRRRRQSDTAGAAAATAEFAATERRLTQIDRGETERRTGALRIGHRVAAWAGTIVAFAATTATFLLHLFGGLR